MPRVATTGRFRPGTTPVRDVAALPIWREWLHGVEAALLRTSPVYAGLGVPHGDGAAVIVVPAFLSTDNNVAELRAWLTRIGYTALPSNIGFNADCPDVLLGRLAASLERAYRTTGDRVHLIGHSLGGLLARVLAADLPHRVRSVTTLGSPFGGITVHPAVLFAALGVQWFVQNCRGGSVSEACFGDFMTGLERPIPPCVAQTAIYTRSDGMVDWRCCITGNPAIDRAVPGSHSGLVLNPVVYELLARRLARTAR